MVCSVMSLLLAIDPSERTKEYLMDFTENYDMFLGEEHEMLRKTVRNFAEKEVAPFIREWDRSGAHEKGAEERPHVRRVLARMADLGLLGICLPAKYGGAG